MKFEKKVRFWKLLVLPLVRVTIRPPFLMKNNLSYKDVKKMLKCPPFQHLL